MTFWKPDANPVRKNHFFVRIGSDAQFTAKTATKPKFDVEESEYKLMNLPLKYPTIPKWQDVTIVFTDTKEQKNASAFYKTVFGDGHYLRNGNDHLPYRKLRGFQIIIEQYVNGIQQPAIQEEWHLVNPFIKSVDFGDSDYSSDDLVEITVTIGYDWATMDGDKNLPSTGGPVSINSDEPEPVPTVPPPTEVRIEYSEGRCLEGKRPITLQPADQRNFTEHVCWEIGRPLPEGATEGWN